MYAASNQNRRRNYTTQASNYYSRPDKYYVGGAEIASFTPAAPVVFGSIKNLDGRIYFTMMTRGDHQRNPIVFKYNPSTNEIEQKYELSIGTLGTDTHRVATLAHDSSGNIWLCCEKLFAQDDSHGGPILIYKTTTPYDITTLTLNNTFTGRWSYPTIQISGNNIFVSARGSTDPSNFDNTHVAYFNSSNLGSSFSAAQNVFYTGGGNNIAYHWRIHSNDGNIYLIFNERNNDTFNWNWVAVVKGSYGSNVWGNVNGTFSKNVSSSGQLSRAEIMTNCMVYETTDYNDIAVNNELGIVHSDGSIKVLISIQNLTGNFVEGNPEATIEELRWYYFSGGSWQYNTVTLPNSFTYYWAYQRQAMVLSNNEGSDDILFIDRGSNNDVYLRRSSDNFATESSTLKLAGNGYYRLGYVPYNITDDADYIAILVDTLPPADIFVTPEETAADYSNFKILPL